MGEETAFSYGESVDLNVSSIIVVGQSNTRGNGDNPAVGESSRGF